MSRHVATVSWTRDGARFTDNRYSRRHVWRFDGGVEVPGSSSPHSVPLPYSRGDAVDPEEAFVASISSCHMLWFLSIAAKRGFTVDDYVDEAEGFLERDASGRMSVTRVNLRPRIAWSGERVPASGDIAAIHDEAHHECFIANSVRTDIRIEA
ncbi:MAG TPA: OsmC family protein [Casimicrobiaceae bacterium]|jgi:organic hydroperoxide reductase OsmC/OhrA|nr:OsmC family protein [Casimicrobiaceae bacterium]